MGKTVLVVDDSLYMRSLIQEALTIGGYEIVGLAPNGEAAIDMALELKPDLITLDNILPDMIGTDILKVLKIDQQMDVKVIMISSVGQESVIKEGIDLGASDYIVKPFTQEKLMESVDKVMSS